MCSGLWSKISFYFIFFFFSICFAFFAAAAVVVVVALPLKAITLPYVRCRVEVCGCVCVVSRVCGCPLGRPSNAFEALKRHLRQRRLPAVAVSLPACLTSHIFLPFPPSVHFSDCSWQATVSRLSQHTFPELHTATAITFRCHMQMINGKVHSTHFQATCWGD